MFTGTPVVKQITDRLVLVTGVSLAAGSIDEEVVTPGAAGTIGLHECTNAPPVDIKLPAGFMPREYDNPDTAAKVTLQESVQVWFTCQNPGPNPGAVWPVISTVKTGTTPQDFQITLTNRTNLPAGSSGPLEIYIGFH